MTEQQLIAAAQGGDQAAFAALVEANQAMVYSLAYRMTGNSEDAADLSQEAFLNAWRGLARFQGQASFATWLYRLTSNACIDFLRREKRHSTLSLTLEPTDEESRQAEVTDERWSPEALLDRQENQTAVRQALTQLSDEHREVLLLRELEGLSYREIAQHLGLEEGTVKSRIARARLSLRDFLLKSGNFFEVGPSK